MVRLILSLLFILVLIQVASAEAKSAGSSDLLSKPRIAQRVYFSTSIDALKSVVFQNGGVGTLCWTAKTCTGDDVNDECQVGTAYWIYDQFNGDCLIDDGECYWDLDAIPNPPPTTIQLLEPYCLSNTCEPQP